MQKTLSQLLFSAYIIYVLLYICITFILYLYCTLKINKMRFTKKPVEVEAITFDELVEHGLENTTNVINGMPLSFTYKGIEITHENDTCYLIPTRGNIKHPAGSLFFTPDDMLVTDEKGDVYPCQKDIFDLTYDHFIPISSAD